MQGYPKIPLENGAAERQQNRPFHMADSHIRKGKIYWMRDLPGMSNKDSGSGERVRFRTAHRARSAASFGF